MRIQLVSDLHMDVTPRDVPALAPGADLVVVAGDVCAGAALSLAAIRMAIPRPTPIVAILGNHEFYGSSIKAEIDAGRRAGALLDVALLENDVAIRGGVRILGCTLWTDYLMSGEGLRPASMAAAREGLNDHRLIACSTAPRTSFGPQQAAELHRSSVAFLDAELARKFDGPTLVVSHHAPHAGSLDFRFAESALNPAFASDLGDLIRRRRPDIWVHGHVHCSSRYCVGDTRILCNPAGYGAENPAFDPAFVFEL